jgi:hypothetical protein
MQDNLNTDNAGSFYENLPPADAFSPAQAFEMHYTPKKGSRLRVHSLYRLVEALQAVHARDEDVGDSAVLQLSHDLHPELRALRVGRPHA